MIVQKVHKTEFEGIKRALGENKIAEALMLLAIEVKDIGNTSNIQSVLKSTSDNIEAMVRIMNKPEVEYDKDILAELRKNTEAIMLLVNKEVKEKPKQWSFSVKRSPTGLIEEINATQI